MTRQDFSRDFSTFLALQTQKHYFRREFNRLRCVAHGVGLGPKGRQLKENPGPTPIPGKTMNSIGKEET